MYHPAKDVFNALERHYSREDAIISLLESYLDRFEQLHSDRVIRCIIYLSQGNSTVFKRYLDAAVKDPRDVMFWAEYEDHNSRSPKRVRDFTFSF
ncbi:hypothetical protein [Psychroserpens sp.]|uniref:hypothetical protein n=1 Tax=Psychroserpens sp. TaxID=2020870 RepID=UPI001B0C5D9E|nr:hypothetical protein [Psychroserpens sp.]MBO6607263.1 hypothetical protein [Psychroserpens sp.]MBO6654661.1 hypothetical protein [Psychroserpens sp.]MBO6680992.1 hypothetical protein [Psychroserpens sp.]MBO6750053.1 hypothetical protein [Psychroserpens sp.]MBO6915961.1 hypothetical protein [Psychroserpens sp.]